MTQLRFRLRVSPFLWLLVFCGVACEERRAVVVPVEGESLHAFYWVPPRPLSAAVLLVGAPGNPKAAWISFGDRLQKAGYAVLALDPRASSSGTRESLRADVAAGFDFLRDQKHVDAARLALVGAGEGAAAALAFSAAEPAIRALVLLSPATGKPEEEAMNAYGWRPVLLAAGKGETQRQHVTALGTRAHGKAAVEVVESEAQGIALLEANPAFIPKIVEFLETHLSPPVLDTGRGGG